MKLIIVNVENDNIFYFDLIVEKKFNHNLQFGEFAELAFFNELIA